LISLIFSLFCITTVIINIIITIIDKLKKRKLDHSQNLLFDIKREI